MPFAAVSQKPDARPANIADLRDWGVRAERDTERLGHVTDMLFENYRLRYLETCLDAEARYVLTPFEYTRADVEGQEVIVLNTSAAELRALPTYTRDTDSITWDYETEIRRAVPAFMSGRIDTGQLPAWTPRAEPPPV